MRNQGIDVHSKTFVAMYESLTTGMMACKYTPWTKYNDMITT